LKSDGSIVGWGHKDFGKADLPEGNDFIAIAAGGSHNLALKSDGSIVGWGYNGDGQAKPPKGNDFVAIAAGRRHSLALRSDGSIVGWGDNYQGKARPPRGNDFVAIAAGNSCSLALKSDGSVVGWGDRRDMVQPMLPKPKAEKKIKKKAKQEATDVVEIDNVSSLKAIQPPPKAIRLRIDNELSIDLIHIKPGSFTMGRDVGRGEKFLGRISELNLVGKYPDDWPARKVKITKGFYIGKYKVTCTQFCKFLNTLDNPQCYVKSIGFARIEMKDGAYVPRPGCENGPINTVQWKGAVAFCDWLSQQSGFVVRLPTEAEWEFAARGPEGRSYPWGEDEKLVWAEDPSRDYKTYPHPWSCAPVDAFPENVTPDGVVGMAGRVGEWCSDFYDVRYSKKDVIDPQGPREEDVSDKVSGVLSEKFHVFRGRGRSTTDRACGGAVHKAGIYGLRIVVELPERTEVDK